MQKLSLIGTCFMGLLVILTVMSCYQLPKEPELDKIPRRYEDKHMPAGWWTDPEVIAEGKRINDGLFNPDVVCASCHGRDGTPKQRRVRDLRDTEYMNKTTDSYMYWRVAEGVPKTKMDPWKEKLTEDQIWKVIAYSHTFSHGGKAEEHNHPVGVSLPVEK